MIVSGTNTVIELLKSDNTVSKIYLSEDINKSVENEIQTLAAKKNIICEKISTRDIAKLTQSKTHQGILAKIPDYKFVEFDEIADMPNAFIVLLDGIEDPHNLGSIIRTCECAGVSGIVLPKNRACQITETVYKTSAGALAHMKIANVTNIHDAIRNLKQKNIWVYALEAGGQSLYGTNLKGNVALVIGSEGNGVSALSKKLCDGIINIPMYGHINSLNASNAAAIVVYEVIRQRQGK